MSQIQKNMLNNQININIEISTSWEVDGREIQASDDYRQRSKTESDSDTKCKRLHTVLQKKFLNGLELFSLEKGDKRK